MRNTSRPETALYRLYFAIGVLLLIQIGVLLLIRQREAKIRADYVATIRLWAGRDSHYDELGLLLSNAAAPVNRSFSSPDPSRELVRLRASATALFRGLDAAETDLRRFRTSDSLSLLRQLRRARANCEVTVHESDQIIQMVARGQVLEASRHMSERHKGISDARRDLTAIRASVRKAQESALDSQARMHDQLEHQAYVLFAIFAVIVIAAITWGQRVMRALVDARRREGLVVELNKAIEAARISEERFAVAARATRDIICEWEIGTERIWRSGALKGTAVTQTSSLAEFESLIHPDDAERTETKIRNALENGEEFWSDEYRVRRVDGSYAVVLDRGYILRKADGTPTRIIGAMVDITEQREAELALALMSRYNSLILQSAAEGIFGIDLDGNTLFVNESAASMLGWTVGEMRGRNMHALTRHMRADGSEYAWSDSPESSALVDGISTANAAELFWRRDGSSMQVEYACRPMRDEVGTIIGAVVTFRDITERRAIETMKDEFISVVSHELRTPLTSIRGALGLLAGGRMSENPEKARRMLDIAVSNTDRLVRLINDILDIERLTSGKVSLARESVVASDLVMQTVDVVRPLADKAGVQLITRVSRDTVYADADRVVQTLTNLVSNAVKFSAPNTTVTISAATESENVRFEVLDEGRGIPADKLQSIFERFQQVDASDSRVKGGTGLGLAICRSIVEQHGGKIRAESNGRKGSRFSFTIPRPLAAENVA